MSSTSILHSILSIKYRKRKFYKNIFINRSQTLQVVNLKINPIKIRFSPNKNKNQWDKAISLWYKNILYKMNSLRLKMELRNRLWVLLQHWFNLKIIKLFLLISIEAMSLQGDKSRKDWILIKFASKICQSTNRLRMSFKKLLRE